MHAYFLNFVSLLKIFIIQWIFFLAVDWSVKFSCSYKVYAVLLTSTISAIKFDFSLITIEQLKLYQFKITTINNNQLDKCTINKNLWDLRIKWGKIHSHMFSLCAKAFMAITI